jgi:hypothetical protein
MTQCDIAGGDFQQKRGALACGSLQRCVIQILDLVPAVRHFHTAPGRSTRCRQTLASLSGAFHRRIPLHRVNFEVRRLDPFACFALRFLAISKNCRKTANDSPSSGLHCVVTSPFNDSNLLFRQLQPVRNKIATAQLAHSQANPRYVALSAKAHEEAHSIEILSYFQRGTTSDSLK